MAHGQGHLTQEQLRELSALADGTLDPGRRAAVEAWIASSPELSALYERERRAVNALRQAAEERAPEHLRAHLDQRRPTPSGGRRRRAWRWAPARLVSTGVLTGAVAACAFVAVLLVSGGSAGPSVATAAQLAVRGPSAAAPAPDPDAPDTQLAASVQALYFPNWESTLGWHATGVRHDDLDGRPATTVYYESHGQRVAYTIIAAPPLSKPTASARTLNRIRLQSLTVNGRQVVTWRERGHTCILSARAVPASELEQLASWRA